MMKKLLIMALTLGLAASSAAFAGEIENAWQGSSGELTKSAFRDFLKEYFPMTPSQIHSFRNALAEHQQAMSMPTGEVPPEAQANIIPVSLKPGVTAPVVRVGQEMITSLVFTDLTGAVWPIVSFSVGNPNAFRINWDKQGGVLMVQGVKLYAQSNIGVMLEGLDVPIMLTLLIGQKSWDYLDYIRVDAAMPGNENAVVGMTGHTPPYLLSLLQGVPPQGSRSLAVNKEGAQAWDYHGKYLLLTRSTLMSPAWVSRVDGPGPNPVHAYEFEAAPYVLLSDGGRVDKIKIGEVND